jgi:DNA helicase-2/ATP-dependent DNA helicase PcrA
MSALQALADQPAGRALTEVFSRSGLQASLAGEETIDEVPLENVQNLINEAGKYDLSEPEGSLIGWLEQTSLASDVDTIDEAAGKVTLMTLHASKGLEFPVVYIVGLEEGLLPFRREEQSEVDEEEERRLCFVGITRAKRDLTLTHVRYRVRRGQSTRSVLSPFLDELPAVEIEWIAHEGNNPRKWRPDGQLPDDVERWEVGTLVRHPDYGLGRLIAIRRSSSRTQVGVAFQDGGQETFVLEFAELTRVPFDEVE